jgi:ribosomal protein L16 Arg81 hydroxylase
MSNLDFDLARVIAPTTTQLFFDKYWERSPLLIQRQSPDYYSNLFSLQAVDHIISTMGLRYPSLRLVRNGVVVPTSEFTNDLPWRDGVFSGLLDPDRILSHYQQGDTIVLQALHHNWQPLALFCRALEKEFSHQVQTNIYLTPPASQGLAPHYDTHDVFVLQIAGVKHWKLYESAMTLPLKSQRHKTSEVGTGQLLQEFDLAPGDMLYLPRGYVHEAVTADEATLHITVGLITYTWFDVFNEVLTLGKEKPEFRTSLPIGFAYDAAPTDSSVEHFKYLANLLLSDHDLLGEAFNNISTKFIASRPPILEGHLADMITMPSMMLEPQTQVELGQGVLYKLSKQEDAIKLIFAEKQISFPVYVEPTLRYILENSPVTLANLPSQLDWSGQKVLVKRLLKEGFLRIKSS